MSWSLHASIVFYTYIYMHDTHAQDKQANQQTSKAAKKDAGWLLYCYSAFVCVQSDYEGLIL